MARRGAPVGNTNAAKAKLWENALKRAIAARYGGDMEKGLQSLAHRVIRSAEGKGEEARWALTEIANRIDGKPKQAIVGDNDEPPVQMEGRIKLVKAD